MTCFWDGLITALGHDAIQKRFNLSKNRVDAKTFAQLLKNNVVDTKRVLWNNNLLTNKQLSENRRHIEEYDTNSVRQGYLCSTCDPFLLLITELFFVQINHNYDGVKIVYSNAVRRDREINVGSNKGHFWAN